MANDTPDWGGLAQLSLLQNVPTPPSGSQVFLSQALPSTAVGLFVVTPTVDATHNWIPQITVTGGVSGAQYGFAQPPAGRPLGTGARCLCPIPGATENNVVIEINNLPGTRVVLPFWAQVFAILGGSPPLPGSYPEQPLAVFASEWYGVTEVGLAFLAPTNTTIVAASAFGVIGLLGYELSFDPNGTYPSAATWQLQGHSSGIILVKGRFNAQTAAGRVSERVTAMFPRPLQLNSVDALDFVWGGVTNTPAVNGTVKYVVLPAAPTP